MNKTFKSNEMTDENQKKIKQAETSLKEMQRVLDRFKKDKIHIKISSSDEWAIFKEYHP